jgi:hypothetical protein
LTIGRANLNHQTEVTRMKSELKMTGAAGVLGALPVLLEMLQGDGGMSEKMMLAMIACVTLMVVAYNVSRGMAKTEAAGGGGLQTTEFKLSAGVAGMSATPVLVDMLKGGEVPMPENVRMGLMFAITAIALSYTLSRGMAKTEPRDAPPPPTS